MRTRSKVLQRLVPVVAASTVLSYAANAGTPAPATFSPEAWSRAADAKSSTWSRKALMSRFVEQFKLAGMERAKVVSLLGEPAHSSELEPGGRYRSRIDAYCLSAKDEDSFRIDYDDKDRVKGYFVEARPCKTCELFAGVADSADEFLKPALLKQSLLQKHSDEQIRSMQIVQLERILGKPHKSSTANVEAGRQLWVHSSYIWRLSPDGLHVFFVSGRNRRVRDYKPGEDPGVQSWAIVSISPACLHAR